MLIFYCFNVPVVTGGVDWLSLPVFWVALAMIRLVLLVIVFWVAALVPFFSSENRQRGSPTA